MPSTTLVADDEALTDYCQECEHDSWLLRVHRFSVRCDLFVSVRIPMRINHLHVFISTTS